MTNSGWISCVGVGMKFRTEIPGSGSDLNRAFNIRPQEIANPFGISSDRPVSSRHIMFDTIKAEISTAAEKLTHLRRFL
jgi:hypothetical protein